MVKVRPFNFLEPESTKKISLSLKSKSVCCAAKIEIENIWFGASLGQKRTCSHCRAMTNIYRQVIVANESRARKIVTESEAWRVTDYDFHVEPRA